MSKRFLPSVSAFSSNVALSYSAFWMAVKTIRKVWKDKDIAKWKVSIALFIAISIVIISAIMLVKKLIIYQI